MSNDYEAGHNAVNPYAPPRAPTPSATEQGRAGSAWLVTVYHVFNIVYAVPAGLLALLVVTVVATALVHEAIALALFLVVLAVLGKASIASMGWLLVALPLQIALTLGLGLLLAALHVFLRDIAQALGLVFSAWFYFTPIVYPLARVPESFRGAIELNPLTALVDLYRSALLGGTPAVTRGFVALVVAAALLLLVGVVAFRRLSPAFADEL